MDPNQEFKHKKSKPVNVNPKAIVRLECRECLWVTDLYGEAVYTVNINQLSCNLCEAIGQWRIVG